MRYLMWAIGSFLVCTALPAAAQDTTGPAEGSESNIFEHLQIELLDLEKMGREIAERLIGEPMRITLDECVHMALEANQDILISGFEPLLAQGDLQASKGEFDPVLTARMTRRDSNTPPSPTQQIFTPFPLPSIEQRFTDFELSVGGKLFWGTQYDVSFSGDRDKGTFTRDPLNPSEPPRSVYGGDVTLTLTQPILRGFGSDSNRVRVRTARKALDISTAQLELTVLTSIGEVMKAYWDLVGAIQQLTVRQESFANAMRLVRINEQRFEIGTAAAIEVLQAKAGAAARQSDMITARTAILDAGDVLKDLIGLYDDDLFSSKEMIPVERPNPVEVDWDMERSMRTALNKRPEIRSAELQVESARLELASARDGLLPQLDITGSYGQNDRTFDFGETVHGLADQNGKAWTVGFIGSVPIGNRSARGAHTRAKLFVRQQEQRLMQAKQQVMLGVRMALRRMVSNEILIESNKQTRILQEANVAAEEKRLSLGVTTSQEVLEIQEDLTEAQTQEVQSMIDFEKALIDLQVSEGTLLDNRGVIFDPAEDEDPLGFFRSIRPVRSMR